MSDLAPEAGTSDNALTEGYTPEASAAPTEQGQAQESTQPANWHSGFSDDFQGLLDKKGLSDLSQQEATEAIGKSYMNLESMRNVPDDNLFNISTDMDDETRNKVFTAMGRPEAADKYSYAPSETDNEELVGSLKESAHRLGLTDKQVNGLMPDINNTIIELANAHNEQAQSLNNEGLTALQKEWGGAWEANKNMAIRAAEHFGINDEMQTAIRDSGNSGAFLKALNQMGGLMAEGAMAGMSPQSGSAAMGIMTPQDAQAEINSKMADPDFKARYLSQDYNTRIAASKELEVFRKAAVGK